MCHVQLIWTTAKTQTFHANIDIISFIYAGTKTGGKGLILGEWILQPSYKVALVVYYISGIYTLGSMNPCCDTDSGR